MPCVRHILLAALLVLLTLDWVEVSAPAFDDTHDTVAAAAGQDDDHANGLAHCATGLGGTCQVPGLVKTAAFSGVTRVAWHVERPGSDPGVALTKVGPPSPVPIG